MFYFCFLFFWGGGQALGSLVFEVDSHEARRACVTGRRGPLLKQTSVLAHADDGTAPRAVTLENLPEYARLVTQKLLVDNMQAFLALVRRCGAVDAGGWGGARRRPPGPGQARV